MVPESYYSSLSAVLFTIGVVGVVVRRNPLVIFMSIELMLNAANLALVAFGQRFGNLDGQVVVFFVMAVAAAEVAVGLAIIVAIFRVRRRLSVDDLSLMRWEQGEGMAKAVTRSGRSSGLGVDAAVARQLLGDMFLIRRFEEKAAEAYALGKIGGFLHLYIGEEAVAVGATSMLRGDDYAISAYREHGHCLAKGSDPKRMMAELFGRRDGLSNRCIEPSVGFLGGHAIVGAHLPLAAGAAFA